MKISPDWIIAVLTVLSVLLIPTLVMMIRIIIKWTRTEDKLNTLVDDMKELVENKDKTHAAMLSQMQADRDVTDRRLRFMEEYFMRNKMR